MTHSISTAEVSVADALSAISSIMDVEQTARQFKAFQRPRHVRSAIDMLRLVLCYGAGLSLREGSAWAGSASIAELSNPGLLQRLRNAPAWLEHIVQQLLERGEVQPSGTWRGRCLRVMDATSLCQPGADRTTWRLHVSYDLTGRVDGIELTDQTEVEHLSRFPCAAGDICIADRGYAKAGDLRRVMAAGADFVVRSGWRALGLIDEQGESFRLFDVLAKVGDQPQNHTAWLKSGEKGKPPVRIRVVIARLPPDQAERARKKLAANIRKRCRVSNPRSLEAAGFVVIATSLDESYSAADILDLYRLRWQIELLFKRFKSLMDLGALPAKCPKLAKTWILAKLILGLLAENAARNLAESSP